MNLINYDAQKTFEKVTDMRDNPSHFSHAELNDDPNLRNVESMASELSYDVAYFLKEFEAKARDMSEKCARLADNVARDQMNTSINGLGEFQQQSLYVDLMCARFQEIKMQLAIFEKLTQ